MSTETTNPNGTGKLYEWIAGLLVIIVLEYGRCYRRSDRSAELMYCGGLGRGLLDWGRW